MGSGKMSQRQMKPGGSPLSVEWPAFIQSHNPTSFSPFFPPFLASSVSITRQFKTIKC